jgi:glycosyltransferase involved in cell wall biosynthesis
MHSVICVSDAVCQGLLSMPGLCSLAGRTIVIRNGIDLRPFRDDKAATPEFRKWVRSQIEVEDTDIVIGSVGLLWPAKGYHFLLPAFSKVLSAFPSARLVLVGAGQQQFELEAMVRQLNTLHRVSFLGWRADVPRLLRAFDLYVQPSLSEGLPIAPMEASAAGLPIVATRVGGVPEVVLDRQTGLLVPPQDTDALAQAIIQLIRDRDLASRLARNARARAFSEFSAEAMAERHVALYNQLFAEAQAGTRGPR